MRYIVVILIVLAGCCNGIMDALQFHYTSTGLPIGDMFWDPQVSWMNKYKNNDPLQGPAFWGSTTFLVALTDAWHLFKFLFFSFMRTVIVLVFVWSLKKLPWWSGLLRFIALWLFLSGVQSLGFHLFYTLIL